MPSGADANLFDRDRSSLPARARPSEPLRCSLFTVLSGCAGGMGTATLDVTAALCCHLTGGFWIRSGVLKDVSWCGNCSLLSPKLCCRHCPGLAVRCAIAADLCILWSLLDKPFLLCCKLHYDSMGSLGRKWAIKSGKLPSNFLPGRAFCSKPQDALSTGGRYFLTLPSCNIRILLEVTHGTAMQFWSRLWPKVITVITGDHS